MDQTSRPATPSSATGFVLVTLSLSVLLSSLGTSIANVGLPAIGEAFDASFDAVQWVVIAYLLAVTVLIVIVGKIGDLVGRRRLLLGGLLLFTAASVACGLAPSLWTLAAARAAQGLGAAVMLATGMALVGETVPKARTGAAMGLLGTMSAVGTALGPTLGGLLIGGAGWRAIFLVCLPLGLAAVALAWRCLPTDRPSPGADRVRFDVTGAVLLAVALGAYALAMTLGRGQFGAMNLALLTAAGVALALFLRVEATSPSPLIRLAMFRDPVLSAGFAMSALVTTVVMASLIVGPFYLSGALHLDSAAVGLAMSCGPVVAALAGAPAGRAVDRFGSAHVTQAGLVAMATGALVLSLAPVSFGLAGYIAPLVVVTAGYALFQAANNTAVMNTADADRRGVVSGLLNLSRNLGLITGASAMGAVFAIFSAASGPGAAAREAVATGMRATFGVAAGLILVALAIGSVAATRRAAQVPGQ